MAQFASQPAREMLMWSDYKQHMQSTLRCIFDRPQFTDCRLIVPGGEVYANRAILSMASGFLDNVFSSTSSLPTAAEITTLLIPDLTYSTLQLVIHFIYTGTVSLRSTEMVQFMEACNMLRIRGVECYNNLVMGIFIEGTDIVQEPTPASTMAMSSESRSPAPHPSTDRAAEDVQMAPSEDPPETVPLDEVYIKVEPNEELEALEQHDPFQMEEASMSRADRSLKAVREKSTPYAVCLSQAIGAVLSTCMSFEKASFQYKVPRGMLWNWTQKVKRASAQSKAPDDTVPQSPADLTATIETVLEQSKREVNDILDGDDESAKLAILEKLKHTIAHDARIMAAHDEILRKGTKVCVASERYNVPRPMLSKRLNNLVNCGPYKDPTRARKQAPIRRKPKRRKAKTSPAAPPARLHGITVQRFYTPEFVGRLKQALRAVVVDGVRRSVASRTYNVKRKTLYNHESKVALRIRMKKADDSRPIAERADAAIEMLLAEYVKPNLPAKSAAPLPVASKAPRPGMMLRRQDDPSTYDMLVQEAICAVTTGQLNYADASCFFQLPKSSIWRNVQKLKNSSPLATEHAPAPAMPMIPTLKPISPTADLHREESAGDIAPPADVPLPEMPELIPFSLDERLAVAVKAIAERGMSYREASTRYDIPKATLWRKMSEQK